MEERNDALEMQEANVQTESLKCSGCGSNMNFDPETQMLKCSYCGMTESFEQSNDVQEIVFDENMLSEKRSQIYAIACIDGWSKSSA